MKLESQIRTKAEEQRKSGQELDSTCQICLKTKFADGIGHLCNYCNVRCCARCGGKVALRSSKVCYLQKKDISCNVLLTVFPDIRPACIIISYSLQMWVLLENTTFSLHKIVGNAAIIRIAGII